MIRIHVLKQLPEAGDEEAKKMSRKETTGGTMKSSRDAGSLRRRLEEMTQYFLPKRI